MSLSSKLFFTILSVVVIISNIQCSDDNPVAEVKPAFKIISPIENSNHFLGDTVQFIVTINDANFQNLGDSMITWTSTHSGEIGKGTDFEFDSLAIGGHRITCTAENLSGGLISDSIEINLYAAFNKIYSGLRKTIGHSVIESSDSSFVVAGEIEPSHSKDAFLTKINYFGDTVWTKSFVGNGDKSIYRCLQTSDNGYLLGGYTFAEGAGDADIYLIKTDIDGNMIWSKTIGGNLEDKAYDIYQLSDGNILLCGATLSYGAGGYDVFLVKATPTGDTLWTRTYGGTEYDYGRSVVEVTGGGYLVVGSTSSFGAGKSDVYLIRTNVNGDTLWTKTIGLSEGEVGARVVETTDGNFLIIGSTQSYEPGTWLGQMEALILKVNPEGEIIWQRILGDHDQDYGYDIVETENGDYLFTGKTYSYGLGFGDVWIVKYNINGALLWSKTYGTNSVEVGNSIILTDDGGIMVCGYGRPTGSYKALYLVKTDLDGNTREVIQ